jgi:hypothetical protein
MTLDELKSKYNLDKAYLLRNNTWVQDGNISLNEGVFVYSNKDFKMQFKENKYINKHILKVSKGWSLKAISTDISIRSKAFGKDVKLYTYKGDKNPWVKYDFSRLDSTIVPLQGFLIYSREDKVYDL